MTNKNIFFQVLVFILLFSLPAYADTTPFGGCFDYCPGSGSCDWNNAEACLRSYCDASGFAASTCQGSQNVWQLITEMNGNDFSKESELLKALDVDHSQINKIMYQYNYTEAGKLAEAIDSAGLFSEEETYAYRSYLSYLGYEDLENTMREYGFNENDIADSGKYEGHPAYILRSIYGNEFLISAGQEGLLTQVKECENSEFNDAEFQYNEYCKSGEIQTIEYYPLEKYYVIQENNGIKYLYTTDETQYVQETEWAIPASINNIMYYPTINVLNTSEGAIAVTGDAVYDVIEDSDAAAAVNAKAYVLEGTAYYINR